MKKIFIGLSILVVIAVIGFTIYSGLNNRKPEAPTNTDESTVLPEASKPNNEEPTKASEPINVIEPEKLVTMHTTKWKLSRSLENVIFVGAYEEGSRLFVFACSKDNIDELTTKGFKFQVAQQEAIKLSVGGLDYSLDTDVNKKDIIEKLLTANTFNVYGKNGDVYKFTSRPTDVKPCELK